MKKKSLIGIALVAVTMLFMGQGCLLIGYDGSGGEVGGGGEVSTLSGEMRVSWVFDGVGICPSDVEDVVIEVRDSSGAKVFNDIILDCAVGVRSIPSLAEGYYTVHMKGLDIDDAITWESGDRRIWVEAGSTAHFTINLMPAP